MTDLASPLMLPVNKFKLSISDFRSFSFPDWLLKKSLTFGVSVILVLEEELTMNIDCTKFVFLLDFLQIRDQEDSHDSDVPVPDYYTALAREMLDFKRFKLLRS